MEQALGSGAVVVAVRHPKPDIWRRFWHRESVEVVALPPPMPVPPESSGRTSPEDPPGGLSLPLKTQGLKMHTPCPDTPSNPPALKSEALAAKPTVQPDPLPDRDAAVWRDRLIMQGIPSSLADDLIRQAMSLPYPAREGGIASALRNQLVAGLATVPDEILCSQRVVCIMGCNGSGKTSLGVKLAVHAMKNHTRRVRWITTDTMRAGAIEKARALTVPMGIPMRLAYSPEELAGALAEDPAFDLTVVDTPGCNPYQDPEVADLRGWLAVLPDAHSILVSPATSKDADLDKAASVTVPLGARSIGITRMDETQTYGGICLFALRCGLPLSCFSVGPRILDDFRCADAALLLDSLLTPSNP